MVNEKTIFLLDGVGAAASFVLLGGVLPALQDLIGMPVDRLYLLCAAPAIFMVYDVGVVRWANHRQSGWLIGIIVANLSYCVLSATLIVQHLDDLTALGLGYFIAELLVLLALVYYEGIMLYRLMARETPHSLSKP